MHSFTYSLFIAVAAAIPQAFAAGADPLAVATVKAQFTNAKVVPDAIPTFGPTAILNVDYKSTVGQITVGQAIGKENVTEQPNLSATGTLNGTYTALMIDADYVGAPTVPAGLNLHWLQNDLSVASDGTFSANGSATIPYAGPGPAAGSGPHRYTVLLYSQSSSFKAPSSPAANSGVARIHLADYVKAAGFSDPVAGSYFTVEVGTSTVSVESTAAVNTATLSVSSASASATGSAGSGSKSGSATASGASASGSSKPSSAGRNVVVGGAAWLSAVAAGFVVFA